MKAGWRSPVSCRQHDDAAPSPLRGALMALATQCPFCQTTFRVANDQLKLRGGLVRCGACNEVFNGSEHLVDPDAVAASPAIPTVSVTTSAVPPAPTIADAPGTTNTFVPRAIPPQQNLSATFAGIAAETDAGPWFTPGQDEPPEVHDDLPPPATTSTANDTVDNFPVPLVSSAPPVPDNAIRFDMTPKAGHIATAEAEAETDAEAKAEYDEPEEAQEEEPEEYEDEDEETPDFVRKAERRQRFGRVARVFMQIGAVLLTLTLLTQATYFWRNQIVGWLPPLQPAFASVCALLHCTVGLPTDISQLSLESSELQLLPPNQNIYTLTLVMRNRSHTAQTWPYQVGS